MEREEKKLPELIATITSDAYKKVYRVRVTGREGLTYETSIPKSVIQRHAEKVKLTPEKFLQEYRAEWLYDDFGGAFVRFVPAEVLR